jgi:hypothetical protein
VAGGHRSRGRFIMSASPVRPGAAALAVRFLGGLQVRQEGRLLPRPFPTRKSASLFAFLTCVDLADAADIYAGLLVWQGEHHFARLQLHRVPGTRAGVDLAACVDGRFRVVGRGNGERRPTWLRLVRTGDELRGLCSADGRHWLACGTMRMPRRKQEVVGLTAHSTYPDDHAWFKTLLLWFA